MTDLTVYRRILVYGGSFDPPHQAHLTLPPLARDAIGADVVAYVPAGQAPHKRDRQQTAAVHRLAMLQTALADAAGVIVLRDEIDRMAQPDPPPSYTIDTLRSLQKRIAPNADLRLLIGTDQLAIFESWKDWAQVIAIAEPVVMVRPPDTVDSVIDNLPAHMDRDAWRRRCVHLPQMVVSSTHLRQLLAAGRIEHPDVQAMLPATVRKYIQQHGLYQS